ncbi:hypothetical protein FEP54_05374 [Burkholderia multivorans]|nr:hypothetical protein [Burkholderia multivorans]
MLGLKECGEPRLDLAAQCFGTKVFTSPWGVGTVANLETASFGPFFKKHWSMVITDLQDIGGAFSRPYRTSFQLPFDSEQPSLLDLLLELRFKLTDQFIALRFDFVLPGKQLAAQLAALALQFALLLLP